MRKSKLWLYYECFGQYLLPSLEKLLEKCFQLNINKTIEIIHDQCNELIDTQTKV